MKCECGLNLENIGGLMLCPECDIIEEPMDKTLNDDKWVQEKHDDSNQKIN